MVIKCLYSLCHQVVTFNGTFEEGNTILKAEGKQTVTIGYSGKGQISQSKQGTTLANASTVKVHLGNSHLGTCIALTNLGKLRANHFGEAVVLVQEIYQFHCLSAS